MVMSGVTELGDMRGFLALGLMVLATVSARSELSPACKADLADVGVRFDETLKRLDKAARGDQGEKCAAYRRHVDVMVHGREVFLRCLTGFDQRENVLQLDVSIGDFRTIVANQNCS